MNLRILMRQWHRWGAIAVALPFLVVISTGLLLQLKKQVAWVQPPEQRGTGEVPSISFDAVLAVVQQVPEAGIRSWADVDRIDVRPGKGIMKVQSVTSWEMQIDLQTGTLLQTAYRRSDLIEQLHDGSWFHPLAKLGLFLPAGAVVLALWITGIYLFLLPIRVRRNRARQAAGA